MINIVAQFLNVKMDYLGFVYDDTVVQSSILKQRPFIVRDPSSKASICVKHLVGRLENIEFKEGKGVGSFLRKLFGVTTEGN